MNRPSSGRRAPSKVRTLLSTLLALAALPALADTRSVPQPRMSAEVRAALEAEARMAPVTLDAAAREALTAAIIARYSPEIARGTAGDAQAWAAAFRRQAAAAEPENLLRASAMPNFSAMLAALQGEPIEGRTMLALLKSGGAAGSKALGDALADTVYTPLPKGRCRVADTRALGMALQPGQTARLRIEGLASYASQGGNGSPAGNGSQACGIPAGVAAYVVNVSATPAAARRGTLGVSADAASPLDGQLVHFPASASAANELIVQPCATCSDELALETSSPVSVQVDVVGYFAAPQATPLECVNAMPRNDRVLGFDTLGGSSCRAGFTAVGGSCSAGSSAFFLRLVESRTIMGAFHTCTWIKDDLNDPTVTAATVTTICCRVPGR